MKKVVGIISIILFFLISFQSCAVGFGNTVLNNKEASGSAGFMLALCLLIAGIIALVAKTKGTVITSIVFYSIGGIIAIANVGSFSDLKIWAIVSFLFTGLLIFHLYRNKEFYLKK